MRVRLLALPALLAACAAEPSAPDTTTDAGTKVDPCVKAAGDGPALLGGQDCDPMVIGGCGFPWPSDVYLVDDSKSPSGKHVAFGKTTLPRVNSCRPMDPSRFVDADGFSPGAGIMTYMLGATTAGFPSQDTIEDSLGANSPTILIEAETGARVAHFTELDQTTKDTEDQAIIIRPVARLKDKTRYIVALRNVKNAAGANIEISPVFKALRDGTASTDSSVEPRKALYADIFGKLDKAGVAKADLQIAWSFTTASKEGLTRWAVAMRDRALALVGEDGPEYRALNIIENPTDGIWRAVEGEFRVPLFLTKEEALTDAVGDEVHLVLDENGLPKQNPDKPWAWYPFLSIIPNTAKTTPAAILAQGHGLLGDRGEGRGGYLATLAGRKNYVTITVDMLGMMEKDDVGIRSWLVGDMGQFRMSVERQHQGMINQLLAMRLMMGRLSQDDAFKFEGKSVVDTDKRYYRGDSQGGIMGVSYMALSTDVMRGYLGEPGMPYNLLLNRSVDFDEFLVVMSPTYRRSRNVQLVLQLLQLLWDRIEPSGLSAYVTSNNLKDVKPKQVLMNVAIGDYQVTPLGAHIIARTIGAKHLTPKNRTIWGLDEQAGPLDVGVSGLQEYSFALKDAPKVNIPPRVDDGYPSDKDPHDMVRKLDVVHDQTDKFLREGIIQSFCEGPCDPE